ncbi:MAG: hypothetical protein ACKESB_03590 [Candidatus Hodgkinia cicadicola]
MKVGGQVCGEEDGVKGQARTGGEPIAAHHVLLVAYLGLKCCAVFTTS